jgi:hypothetical protein
LPKLLSFCGSRKMNALSRVNKSWNAVMKDESVWRVLCEDTHKVRFLLSVVVHVLHTLDELCHILSHLLPISLQKCSGPMEKRSQAPGRNSTSRIPAFPSITTQSRQPLTPSPLVLAAIQSRTTSCINIVSSARHVASSSIPGRTFYANRSLQMFWGMPSSQSSPSAT